MKPPYLINRLGNDNQVDISVLGPNGTRAGSVAYSAGGVLNCNSTNSVNFPGVFTNEKAIVGWWYTSTYASTDTTTHRVIGSSNDVLQVFKQASEGGDILSVGMYGVTSSLYRFDVSWAGSQKMHMVLKLDNSLGAELKIALYIDGALQGIHTIVADDAWANESQGIKIGYDANGIRGVVDTLKAWEIFEDLQLILDHSSDERFGLNDQVMAA